MMKCKLLLATVAAAGIAASANATVTSYGSVTMYTTQAEFIAALTAANEIVAHDDFDDLAATALGASLTRPAGDMDYSVSSINYHTKALDTLVRTGSGSDYSLTTAAKAKGVTYPGDYLKFTDFSAGVNAVGINFTELGSSTNQIGALALDADGDGGGHIFSVPANNFVGFISTNGFSQVQLYAYLYPAGIEPVVTGLYLGEMPETSDVPEPASWALMTGGFGIIGGAMRRKKATMRFV